MRSFIEKGKRMQFQKILTGTVCGVLLLPCMAELISDGSFERSSVGKTPACWHAGSANGCSGKFQVTEKEAFDGKKALLITNRTAEKPNVYSHLSCSIPLVPGESYQLFFAAKGENVNGFTWTFGKQWRKRFHPKNLSSEWQSFSYEFIAEAGEFNEDGTYLIQIITEDMTDSLFIDGIKLKSLSSRRLTGTAYQKERFYPVASAGIRKAVRLKLPETPEHYTGKPSARNRLSAEIAMELEKDGIRFLADVRDNTPNIRGNGEMWMADSIQLRIDQRGDRHPGEDLSDLELGFQVLPDGTADSWCWQLGRKLSPSEADIHGKRTAEGYQIRALLKWSLLNRIQKKHGTIFSFNAIVNNETGYGREVAFLAPGIHTPSKSSSQNMIAVLDDGKPYAVIVPEERDIQKKMNGRIFFGGVERKEKWSRKIRMTDSSGNTVSETEKELPVLKKEDSGVLFFRLNAEPCSDGVVKLSFPLTENVCAEYSFFKRDRLKEQNAFLEKARLTLQTLLSEREHSAAEWKKSRYLDLYFSVLSRQIELQKKDLESAVSSPERMFYLERGEVIVREIDLSLKRLIALMENADHSKLSLPTWKLISSPSVFRSGWFRTRMVDENGRQEERECIFTGFGHFADVVRDIPLFQKIGANLIQIEIGPNSFFRPPLPGKDDFSNVTLERWRKYIEPAMKKALEHNIKICLLLSPHYNFDWYVVRQKDLSEKSNPGYRVNDPRARRMIRNYLDIMIPLLAKSPYRQAIHSLCLSNEPNAKACRMGNPHYRPVFVEYLKRKYGTVEKLNLLSGERFRDFESVFDAGETNPAAHYVFQMFKREQFAGWHEWMAEIVHAHWKEIPVHVKTMAFHGMQRTTLGDGVDPELFARFSDLNGNDNYNYYDSRRWGSNWVRMAMTHDLQYSMAPKSIANTENHLIPDGSKILIPPEHIYAANLQQYLHGASSLVTWVYVDQDYKAYRKGPVDLQGGIYRRPSSLIAQGEALLDANRISREILQFNSYPPEIRILYSPSSLIHDPDRYSVAAEHLYMLLNFTGHKIGFISEDQLSRKEAVPAKMIFLPDTGAIGTDALKRLKEFSDRGCRIISYGNAPSRNEFGKKLGIRMKMESLDPSLEEQRKLEWLKRETDRVEMLPFQIRADHPSGNIGILFRSAKRPDGSWLINLVNYNTEKRKVHFDFGTRKAVDLISGKSVSGIMELAPLEVFLLELK